MLAVNFSSLSDDISPHGSRSIFHKMTGLIRPSSVPYGQACLLRWLRFRDLAGHSCVWGHYSVVGCYPQGMAWSCKLFSSLKVPSTLDKYPILPPAKHPQTCTLPPPCFNNGIKHHSCIFVSHICSFGVLKNRSKTG